VSALIHIAIASWFTLVFALFWRRPAAEAVVTSFVVGWLFLPIAGYPLTGFHSKFEIVATGVLLGSLVFAPGAWLRFRPSLVDLPMAVAILSPFVSAVSNEVGLYNSGSDLKAALLRWGIPYLIGRVYLSDLRGLRLIALGLFLGGLGYVPFCLYEIRMSPQLHRMVYGFHQHEFLQTVRWGGFRPMVFMHHGLALGLWMTLACLAGYWLWRAGGLKRLWGVPMQVPLAILLLTTLLVKSFGSLVLLAVGLAVLTAARSARTSVPVVMLVLVAPGYIGARASGYWSGRELLQIAGRFDAERAQSMQTRLENEDELIKRAMEKKAFGWGGFGRAEVRDEDGRSLSVRDGFWIIVLGEAGLVGLIALTSAFLVPPLFLIRRYRTRLWRDPVLAPAAVLAVVLPLFIVDSLANFFASPLFPATAGAIAGFALRAPVRARRRVRKAGPAGWAGPRIIPEHPSLGPKTDPAGRP
jgi:hypothetical protein